MILALLIGCLTPATFAEQYVDIMCAEVEECSPGGVSVPMCGEEYDATVEILGETIACDAWDAEAAADCLDARASRSGCNDSAGGEECTVVLTACQ